MIINNEAIVLESFLRFVTWHACIFLNNWQFFKAIKYCLTRLDTTKVVPTKRT